MRSQLLWTTRIWNTMVPLVQEEAPRKQRRESQPYRRRSVTSQECLTRWMAHLRTSILRPRCWTCPTCRSANQKPSNVILSSACGNSQCYLMRLKMTLERRIRQQEGIPKCADATDYRGGSNLSRNISTAPLGTMTGTLATT